MTLLPGGPLNGQALLEKNVRLDFQKTNIRNSLCILVVIVIFMRF